MAITYLTSADSNYKISNNNTDIRGTDAADENVLIQAGVTGTKVASTVEKVDLPGAVADYKFKQGFGSNIEVTDAAGNVVMTLTDLAAKKLSFTDGTVDLAFDAATGKASVGGKDITTTAAVVVPTTIDTTDKSETGTGTGTGNSTFTLTSGADTFSSSTSAAMTSANEKITGTIGTWTSNDSIIDPSTTDNDELVVEINNAISATVKVENVEKISINTLTANAINGTSITGAKEINNASSTGVLTINNVDLSVDHVLSSTVGGMNLQFDAGSVNGGNDKVNVSLTSMGGAALTTGAGVETVIVGLDADSSLNSIATGAATLQFNGGKAFTLNAPNSIPSNVTTIDARQTSAFSASITQNATGTAILTGAGDDSITAITSINANDVFSLGGGNDTLKITTNAGNGAAAVYQGVENITSTIAVDNINLLNSDQASVITIKGGGSTTVANMFTGSTVTSTTNILANTVVGFSPITMGEVFNLDAQAGLNGSLTANNIKDFTVTINGPAGSALGAVTLDSTATAANGLEVVEKFTIIANTSSTAAGAISFSDATSDLKELTLTGNAALTMGTMGDAVELETLTINAIKAPIIMGAIGNATSAAALNTIDINGTGGAVTIGAITATNSNGISTVDIDATGGNFTGSTLTNTGAIKSIIIKGPFNATQNYTSTGGTIEKLDATGLTGSLTTTIINNTTANTAGDIAGSTVTLGNVGTGASNTVIFTGGTNLANTITGGTGVDIITGAGGEDIISGGAGNDVITGAGDADSLTGGLGVDTFNFASAGAGTGGTSGILLAASHDVITDYSGLSRGQNDIIDDTANAISVLEAPTTATTVQAGIASIKGAVPTTATTVTAGLAEEFDTADNTLAEQIVAVEAALSLHDNLGALAGTIAVPTGGVVGEAAVWVNGANSYLFISDGVVGIQATDVLVELVGITVLNGITIDTNGAAGAGNGVGTNIIDIA